jgi:1-acyl-sn-glycerol-3-phosphate acyltransferase
MKKYLVGLLRMIIAYSGLTFLGLLSFSLYVCSLGYLKSFNYRYIIPLVSRGLLFLFGIKFVVKNTEMLPKKPVVYMFNHNSFLDVFMVGALGLEKTKNIISIRTAKIIPLLLINLSIGSFYIPFKNEPEKRLHFFKKLTTWLKSSDESILCAPEGVHTFIHGIAKFNKGVFHAALESRRDICPLYFHIPWKQNSFEGYFYEAGTVTVEILPFISTTNWDLNNLEHHIQDVRARYLHQFNTSHEVT